MWGSLVLKDTYTWWWCCVGLTLCLQANCRRWIWDPEIQGGTALHHRPHCIYFVIHSPRTGDRLYLLLLPCYCQDKYIIMQLMIDLSFELKYGKCKLVVGYSMFFFYWWETKTYIYIGNKFHIDDLQSASTNAIMTFMLHSSPRIRIWSLLSHNYTLE